MLPKPWQKFVEISSGKVVKVICCPRVEISDIRLVVYRYAEAETLALEADKFLDGRFQYVPGRK